MKLIVFRQAWLLILLILACNSPAHLTETNPRYQEYKIIKAGFGFSEVRVGQSTREEVQSKLGDDFEEVKHGSYTVELKYSEKGVSFYYCYRDPNKIIFLIRFFSPFKGVTKKNIVLNESTMREVTAEYGEPYWTTSNGKLTWTNNYRGIGFLVQRDTTIPQFPFNRERHIDKQVIRIDVSNNCQCDMKFPPPGVRYESVPLD